jgi:pyridoxamine 5'-phosphate oxidase
VSFTPDIASTRRSYGTGELTEDSLAPTWFAQLEHWYAEASSHPDITEPNAMQVATVDASCLPDVRTVLARGLDDRGVVFYTNYDSVKGDQLAAHPWAAAVLVWLPLERQVRFRGPVSKVSPDETAAYFRSRPRGAQLAAWASPQSEVIAGRRELDALLTEVTERFGEREIPPPPNWGGYRISVNEIEFWQGRQFRLHDRIRYRQTDSGDWVIERLAP